MARRIDKQDTVSGQVIRTVDRIWQSHSYDKAPKAVLFNRIVSGATDREREALEQAGIILDCPCNCQWAEKQALTNFHTQLRRYKENGRRTFVYVPGRGKKPGVWVHVAGLCYLATVHQELREHVIHELEDVAEALEQKAAGHAATAASVRALVGELKAGKPFDQPPLLPPPSTSMAA